MLHNMPIKLFLFISAMVLFVSCTGVNPQSTDALPNSLNSSQQTANGTSAAAPTAVAAATSTPPPTAIPTETSTLVPTTTATPTSVPAATAAKPMTREKDGMVMVNVPGGPFIMGSDIAEVNEKPSHTVTLPGFWIDQTEVTNAMFGKFVKATNYLTEAEKPLWSYEFNLNTKEQGGIPGADWRHPRGPKSSVSGLSTHPVVHVSWNDSAAYCEWVGARLPSEAEWEKSARGVDGRTYPWGEAAPDGKLLNYADVNLDVDWADKSVDDGNEFTAPVGSYPTGVSPYGAYDMAGNVWEWVADWYADSYYQDSPSDNPTGPTAGDGRTLRGGSWNNEADFVRTSNRVWYAPVGPYGNLGFRCAKSN